MSSSKDVLDFWFVQLSYHDWFRQDSVIDRKITNQFDDLLRAARACELWHWRSTIEGRLAEIIVLDQFSRNIFRDHAEAFRADTLALGLAQEAVASAWHEHLQGPQRAFLLMPYMHSESRLIHIEAVRLFSAPGLETNLDFELRHKAIIDRFGRYPHRNQVLGRTSTPEEVEFLNQPGSSF